MLSAILAALGAMIFVSHDGPLTIVAVPLQSMEGGPIAVHVCVASRAAQPIDLIVPGGGVKVQFSRIDEQDRKEDLKNPDDRFLNSLTVF